MDKNKDKSKKGKNKGNFDFFDDDYDYDDDYNYGKPKGKILQIYCPRTWERNVFSHVCLSVLPVSLLLMVFLSLSGHTAYLST